jgi:hypothetical protein
MRGRSNRSARKREIVLGAIAEGLTVTEAARRAGMSWRSVYDWKSSDPTFASDFEAAFSQGTDTYEAEARRRAFNGSDALLIFALKCRDPHRFNRRMIAIGGDPDAPPVTTAAVTGAWIYPRAELRRPAMIEAEADDPATDVGEEEAA